MNRQELSTIWFKVAYDASKVVKAMGRSKGLKELIAKGVKASWKGSTLVLILPDERDGSDKHINEHISKDNRGWSPDYMSIKSGVFFWDVTAYVAHYAEWGFEINKRDILKQFRLLGDEIFWD